MNINNNQPINNSLANPMNINNNQSINNSSVNPMNINNNQPINNSSTNPMNINNNQQNNNQTNNNPLFNPMNPNNNFFNRTYYGGIQPNTNNFNSTYNGMNQQNNSHFLNQTIFNSNPPTIFNSNPPNNNFFNRTYYGGNYINPLTLTMHFNTNPLNNRTNIINPMNNAQNNLLNQNTLPNNGNFNNYGYNNPPNLFQNSNNNFIQNNNMNMYQNPFYPNPNPMLPFRNNLNNSLIYQPYLSVNNINMNWPNNNYNNYIPPPLINNNNKNNNEINTQNNGSNELVLPKEGNNIAKMQLFKELDEFQYKNKDKFDIKLIEDTCSICLAEYKIASILKIFPCGHIFHKKCIRDWLIKSNECPICKHDLTNEINLRKEELEKNFAEEEKEDEIS